MASKQQAARNTHDSRSTNEESNDNLKTEGLRSFAQDTTLHGARFLFVNNIFRRVIWSLALISCFAYCSYQVYSSVKAFYKHPFHTRITTEMATDDSQLSFPAITLCNVNPYNTRRYRQLYEYIHQDTATEEKIKRRIEDMSLMLQRSQKVSKEEFRKRNPKLFDRSQSATDEIILLSHQIDEMLLPSHPSSSSHFTSSCSINGLVCGPKNFSKKTSIAYGQCYTFNSAKGDHPLLNATLAGKDSGLKLRLNVERDSYFASPVIATVGLVVIIHDQKSDPLMEGFGIVIQPGISTVCAIKRRKVDTSKGGLYYGEYVEMINLPQPYATNCTNQALDDSDSFYAYTKQACVRKCRNDYTTQKCSCRPPELHAKAPICALNDTSLCIYPSQAKFGNSKERRACEKNCPEPCEHVEYETSLSFGGLQRDVLIEHLISFLNNSNSSSIGRAIYEPLLNMTKLERERYIDDNIISLDIYFEDLAYQVIKQTPFYETWTLVGNLGGTFGLFLGMSCLTVFEFLDFVFRRMCHFFKEQKIGKGQAHIVYVE